MYSLKLYSIFLAGKVYDLGGQVLAANSAPVIFNLARETGTELEEMDLHKMALIDSSTGEFQDIQVADDYMSLVSLTLELQVNHNLRDAFLRTVNLIFL